MMTGPIPPHCPSCGEGLRVVKLECGSCGTMIEGQFQACPICRLDGELRRLFDLFLKSRGNLKDVQRSLGLSYPTVRQRVEAMFRHIAGEPTSPDRLSILERVREGALSVEAAAKLLRGDAPDPDGDKT